MRKINVTVWNEGYHEKHNPAIAAVYPEGIHGCIAAFLKEDAEIGTIRQCTLETEGQGLTEEILSDTDVLIWWGHVKHGDVTDENVNRVYDHVVTRGMGLIVLHSGHASKIFQKICGTKSYDLKWREHPNERERVWVIEPAHPICAGLPQCFELPHEEMYGERFEIPAPDELVFISWFAGGEVFRSGLCYNRGIGKVFYFRPGHEAFPTFFDKNVQTVIKNAVKWAALPENTTKQDYGWFAPLEDLGDPQ